MIYSDSEDVSTPLIYSTGYSTSFISLTRYYFTFVEIPYSVVCWYIFYYPVYMFTEGIVE